MTPPPTTHLRTGEPSALPTTDDEALALLDGADPFVTLSLLGLYGLYRRQGQDVPTAYTTTREVLLQARQETQTVSYVDQLVYARRELRVRRGRYEREQQAGTMTPVEAARLLAPLQAIVHTLTLLVALAAQPPQPYRVTCYRECAQGGRGLSEWHTNLPSALAALAEHQQRPWSSVALEPQFPRAQEQLALILQEDL